MKKERKKYTKPEVIRIPMDFRQMLKNLTCPYLFIYDGKDYIKENSLLPDSEDLLREEKILNDYYVLKNKPKPKDGYLSFKIKELAEDLSWFNSFKLVCVESPDEYKIGFNNEGQLFSYRDVRLPTNCVDKDGRSYLAEVSLRNFMKPELFFEGRRGDILYLDFGKINCNFTKLIIVDPLRQDCNGLCTGLLSYENLADECTRFSEDWRCNLYKTSIHIFICLEHQWQHIACLHTRAEFYPDIVDLTPYLPQIKGNLKIKLEFTAPHKVAFVGIDTTPPIPMKKKVYPLKQAIHTEFGDVTEILREENDKFVRLYPGEEIELKFPVPEPAKRGNKLSYVLYSKGYYIPTMKLLSLAKTEALAVA